MLFFTICLFLIKILVENWALSQYLFKKRVMMRIIFIKNTCFFFGKLLYLKGENVFSKNA